MWLMFSSFIAVIQCDRRVKILAGKYLKMCQLVIKNVRNMMKTKLEIFWKSALEVFIYKVNTALRRKIGEKFIVCKKWQFTEIMWELKLIWKVKLLSQYLVLQDVEMWDYWLENKTSGDTTVISTVTTSLTYLVLNKKVCRWLFTRIPIIQLLKPYILLNKEL